MKTGHHTAEQIIKILDQKILDQSQKGEQTIGAICRQHGIAEATFYRWRTAYGGMSVPETQRLKDLEKENVRLKRRAQRAPPSVSLRLTCSRNSWKKRAECA